MNAQAKEQKKKVETLVIKINLMRGGVTLLVGALLIMALFGYLAWGSQKAHAQSKASASNSAPLADAATGYISVPASAFQPFVNGLEYLNQGHHLAMTTGSGALTHRCNCRMERR